MLAQDARGDERENRLLAADHERVAGVVPALKARHGDRALGHEVNDLALALIPPLGADHDDELAHDLANHKQNGETDEHAALSLIHISEPTRLGMISYAVF